MPSHEYFDVLQYNRPQWKELFLSVYGKGEFHSNALFSHLYKQGNMAIAQSKDFLPVPALAQQLEEKFPFQLLEPKNIQEDTGHIKFALKFPDGLFSESVILKMKTYQTLCVSSQTGCRWACQFCQTGKLGLKGNLSAGQIVMQLMVAKFHFNAKIKNLVFMGMGEPLDNYEEVLQALSIISDPYGLNIGAANITISTVGHLENLEKFRTLITLPMPGDGKSPDGSYLPPYRNVKLAVSLNAADNNNRNKLMPVNSVTTMEALKDVLQSLPIERKDHDLFIEYVLIPGINSSEKDAQNLVDYLQDLPCVVNLIPYHPYLNSPWRAPTDKEIQEFFLYLIQHGQTCRLRHSRGEKIAAACGQLGLTYQSMG